MFEARGGLALRVPGWCLERLFPVPNFSKTLNKRSVTLRGKLILVRFIPEGAHGRDVSRVCSWRAHLLT